MHVYCSPTAPRPPPSPSLLQPLWVRIGELWVHGRSKVYLETESGVRD